MARSPLVMPEGQRFTATGAPMRARTAAVLVAAAVGLGVGSASSLIGETPPVGAVQVGPWVTFPALGSSEVDPYARAILARSPHLPLSTGEGVTFRTASDSSGSALNGSCSYRLTGRSLPSRGWTLTVTDPEGRALTGALAASLTDADLVTGEDGLIDIKVRPSAAAGAWLRTPADRRYGLVLNFYDTPLSASVAQLGPTALPRIDQDSCR